jgi:ribosome-associated protein
MVSTNTIEGRELALTVAGYADQIGAESIVVLDLQGISSIADYFVLCTGTSNPHVKAIHREVSKRLKDDHSLRPRATDGKLESQWLVLDFIDVIVHIFHKDLREHYSLEDLWSDAEQVPFESSQG